MKSKAGEVGLRYEVREAPGHVDEDENECVRKDEADSALAHFTPRATGRRRRCYAVLANVYEMTPLVVDACEPQRILFTYGQGYLQDVVLIPLEEKLGLFDTNS